jgi:hypothetical protein
MNTDYEQVFRHRGASYHKAMLEYPGVRSLEFQRLFHRFPLKEGESLIDCPALGGYLQSNVPEPLQVTSLDYCPQSDTVQEISSLNTLEEKFDRVVCLAASHHIGDLYAFIDTLQGKVKTGGLIHLADVTAENPIRLFLDDFVGKWTSTGHSGIWRCFENLFPADLVEIRQTPWIFRSEEEMVLFCRLLFGLDLNPSGYQILEALDRYVGVDHGENFYRVNWKLTYVDMEVE